jgi:RNA polymerase sigma factor (TIGR02999 family)
MILGLDKPTPARIAHRASRTVAEYSVSFCNVWIPPMSEVTRVLSAIEGGDPHAAEQLLPLVYEELRKLAAQQLAQEKPGQTLDATALVHEAYLRLVGPNAARAWNDQAHFLAAAAEAMRRILIDRARRKRRFKRGVGWQRVPLADAEAVAGAPADELLSLDAALERLAATHPNKAQLVKLRYFAGLSLEEAAAVLGVSRATASRHWNFARAWLINALDEKLE